MRYNISSINTTGFRATTCFFLLFFCSFFSINSLPINPVYCLGVPLLFLSFLFLNGKVDRFQFGFYIYFIVSCLIFGVGSYYFSYVTPDVSLFSTILYLYCILLGAQVIAVGLLVKPDKRKKIYGYVYNILIAFMVLELFLRIVFAGSSGSFYDYKSSLFFKDSNFTSFIIIFFLMFSFFLKEKKIWFLGNLKFFLLLFLLLMTFSRASILAFFISYIFIKSTNKFKMIIFIFFILTYFYFSYLLVGSYISGNSYVDIDGSFNSKFYIISVAIDNYFYLPEINKIFGIGLNNFSYYADGRFAHNILVTMVYEFGWAGSLSFLIFLIYAYKRIGKDITYILMPLLVAGFSLFSAYMPFFFVLIGCMYVELKNIQLNRFPSG